MNRLVNKLIKREKKTNGGFIINCMNLTEKHIEIGEYVSMFNVLYA